MAHVREPTLPPAQVSIMLPNLKNIRSVVEKMKSVSQYITLSATNSGGFKLHVSSEVVEIEVFYRDLHHDSLPPRSDFGSDEDYQQHLKKQFSCNISMKNFVNFLYSHYIVPQNVRCVLIDNHAVIFTVYISPTTISAQLENEGEACGALNYYIPAYSS
ncbi:hypothetical protein BB560_007101 [Smittium megazygosporum]|uniref:Checkpoint protein n=1 Tax=Smittium megazygosporum TaxID=133381 RepID=A0A2T9XYS0_9FUNG|nr:hypothetical protein BB560_007101 [Smittium megazygosporum]